MRDRDRISQRTRAKIKELNLGVQLFFCFLCGMANEEKYKGQILAASSYLDLLLTEDWSGREEEFRARTSVEHLAKVACMSRRLFQAEFQRMMHESVGAYRNRLRMERAQILLKDHDLTMAEVSDAVGFANAPAFHNTFRRVYHSSPLQRQAQLVEGAVVGTIPLHRMEHLCGEWVIYMPLAGAYSEQADVTSELKTWDVLEAFARKRGIHSTPPRYWGIALDDEAITSAEQCRFYAAVSVEDAVHLNVSSEIKAMQLPDGAYAVYTHRGAYEDLGTFYDTIFADRSIEAGDGPVLERYLNAPTEVPVAELVTEVWIPTSAPCDLREQSGNEP